MSFRSVFAILFFSVATLGIAQNLPEGRLLRFPDVSKDKIAFSYGGDLWLVSRDGGTAQRITSHPGQELFAKFSPDGKTIAFTSSVYPDCNDDACNSAIRPGAINPLSVICAVMPSTITTTSERRLPRPRSTSAREPQPFASTMP